jgi:hypothetical protein
MELRYRGITYTITQGSTPDVWRWQVMVGNPAMLRLGEASTEADAETKVKSIIDRSIKLRHRNQGSETS